MNWLKNVFVFLIIISSLCLEQIVTACGWGEDPYDDYTSFFHNNVAGSLAYKPFYLVDYYEYYDVGDWGSTGDGEAPADLNLKEWLDYGSNKFTLKDAADFIYKYPRTQLSNLYYHIEKGNALQLPDSVRKNSMTTWFLQQKDLEALGYLMFAKKCEANAMPTTNWEAPQKDLTGMNANIKGGLQLWKAAKSDFFKWRYAYQVLRMAFYSDDYKRTFELYKELTGDKTAGNIMYYRCLSLKAGACYKTGDYNTAAYLYSLAFQGTDDNKLTNYVSYDWCFGNHGEAEHGPRATTAAVAAMATTNTQKAALHVMDALHDYKDAVTLMKNAYTLDPKIEGLDVAMVREINKLERDILDLQLSGKSGFQNESYTSNNNFRYLRKETDETRKLKLDKEKELKDLITFGTRLTNENKTGNPAFWPLSVAYLYFIEEDWTNCELWIGKAEKMNPQGKVKDMLHVEQLLLAINKNQKLDAPTEAKILPSLQWLEQRANQDQRFAITYRNIMTTVLPNIYVHQQDTLKALLCIAKGTTGPDGKGMGGYYAYDEGQPSRQAFVEPGGSVELEQVTTAQIIALKDWIKGAKKSPYESFLVKYAPYENGALDMYIGTRYIRQMDFGKAVDIMKNTPKEALARYSFQDPFAERWTDTQEPADTNMVSNKFKFAKDMYQLQQTLDKATAEQVYQYANGLYSMTYYGLSWSADMYYRSGSDWLGYYDDKDRADLLAEYKNYYSAEEARKYYQLAFDRSNDKELKAKCLFMLSKCWQKNVQIPREHYYDPATNNEYYLHTLKSPYFSQLNKDYNQTKSFQMLFEECSYLKLYVRKMSRQ